MEHRTRHVADAIVLEFSGEVDLEQSPKARKVLLGALEERRPIYVDLRAVSYIDSSGIACLVEAYQVAKRKEVPFELVRVSESARRVFELARLDRVFVIRDALPEGLDG